MTVLADAPGIRCLTDDDLAAMFAGAPDETRDAIVGELGRRDRLEQDRRKRDAQREAWQDGAYAQMLEAERECCGNLVNRRGVAMGITDWSLWSGPESRALAYATEELRNFWDAHPRVTVTDHREQIAAGRRIQRDEIDRAKYAAEREDKMIGELARGAVRTAEFAARQQQARQRVSARTAEIRQASGVVATREAAALARKREPVDGAEVLRDTRKFLRHFALWPSEAALIVATLWIAASWARDGNGEPVWEYCAKLLFTASDYGAGKSWFAKLTASLCPAGMVLLEPSKASLLDEIAQHKTIVVTEVDELFATPGRNRGIIAALNGSYEPGHYNTKMSGGKSLEIHVFGFQILDGLDTLLSGTRKDMRGLASRCIPLHVIMAPDGYARPRWNRDARDLAARGRDRLCQWVAEEVAGGIADVVPALPEGLGNPRRCAMYEPMFAMAMAADRAEIAARAEDDRDRPGYWSTALAEAAVQVEAAAAVPEESDRSTELDDIMASWDED